MSDHDSVSCDHDWRVNPHVILTSYPGQFWLVCAKCEARRPSGPIPDMKLANIPESPSMSPSDWEKWNG